MLEKFIQNNLQNSMYNSTPCNYLMTTGLLFFITSIIFPLQPSYAGELRNNDPKTYTYRIFWNDLSPTVEDEIKPKEEKKFDDKACTIQLMKQLDNIFVRPHETIVIHDGILHRTPPK